MQKLLSAGQAIVDGLIRNGVRHIFGIPGVHTYALIDALQERQAELAYLGTRHEQGAAYMAYGYARSSGRIGAYTCVPGPGVLNTSAALCTAYAANAPVLCLTSEIFSHEIGRGHGILHELPDQLAILRGLTKWSARIGHPTEAPRLVARAFEELTGGRPRPVALECPWDVLGQKALLELEAAVRPAAPPPPDADAVERAAKLIAGAAAPLIMVGSGALGAGAEVLELARSLQAPVTAHRSGRGIVSEDSPYGLDLAAAYLLWAKTDVLIAIGTRMELQFIRWKQVPPALKIVRIDIDPEELPRRPAEVGIVTDARLGVRALIEALARRLGMRASREAEFGELKARARREFAVVQPQLAFLDAIRTVLPRDGFFVEEISQVGFTARFGFPVYEPRTYVASGYQDNLGFGYMTSLGVKVANPTRAVVSVNGDGGFMFGVQELASAVQHGIGSVAIVFNNRSFGNVLRDQETLFGGRFLGERLRNPDFVRLAESFGAAGYRAATPEELRVRLERALSDGAPALIEVPLEPGAEVSPWPFIHRS
ncbi:MAG TPA: thiamine pyrophosphate-dependent enzyme [Steroidobacteraceae bacterium]|jgi:acetolactate synthase-1/2/3 large subunit|nr:thiamine pyrophosphate-dependent enzyme [Steroidobacteraceae bacterium]